MSKSQRSRGAGPAAKSAPEQGMGKATVDTAGAKPNGRTAWLIAGGALLVLLMAAALIWMRPGAAPGTAPAAGGAGAALPAEISVADARQKYDGGTFMLDVRQPEEWNEGHIPNATLIPLGELPNRLAELPKDQEIVVVCRSGNRSATGRDILLNAGFSAVTSMAGGMNQWQSVGYPTVSGP